jgi:hypothetical protein
MWVFGFMILLVRRFRLGTIMNRTFRIGFLLAVTVHLTFGCCLHHEHASGAEVELSSAVETSCACEHHAQHHDGHPGNHDGSHEPCDEGVCRFTRPDTSASSDFLDALQYFSLVLDLPSPPSHRRVGQSRSESTFFQESVSLHLLNQVFLL